MIWKSNGLILKKLSEGEWGQNQELTQTKESQDPK